MSNTACDGRPRTCPSPADKVHFHLRGHHNHPCSPAAKALKDKWFLSISTQESRNLPTRFPTKSCIDPLSTLIYIYSRK